MAVERISIDLDTSDPAVARFERHSYVNLINVVHAELQLIERMIGAPGALRSAIHLAEAASHAFKEARVARRHLAELARFAELTEADLQETLESAGVCAEGGDVREAVGILRDVLPDAHLRIQEVIARHRLPRPVSRRGVERLSELLNGRGVQLRVDGAGEWSLPEGSDLALLMMADPATADSGPDRTVRLREVEIDRCGEVRGEARVAVRGTGPAGWSRPLYQNLRPSELHTAIASGVPALRGAMLLAYCSMPCHSATLCVDGDRSSGLEGFTLVTDLPVADIH